MVAAVASLLALLAIPASSPAHGKDKEWGPKIPLVEATPENVVWGGFPIDQPAIATVKSGQTVRINTISQSGATNATLDPVQYFGLFGVRPNQVLQDVKDFWAAKGSKTQYGPHILTGPVYVKGAEPGDTLKIEVLDLDTRVPYGLNNTSPFGGVLGTGYPGFRAGDPGVNIPEPGPHAVAGVDPDNRQHLYWTGYKKGQEVAFFNDDIDVPLRKFMGVMGVAPADGVFVPPTAGGPPPATGVQSSIPPGPFGGNMDVKDLGEGVTLYLPVFQEGAQFFTGDSHSAQGDGEVSGTAIEHSLAGTFKFSVIKKPTVLPWAEDDDKYIIMGIDHDLDRAMRIATYQTVKFLAQEKGLSEAKAFSLASIAIDFHASEVVDGTQVVSGLIPKSLFKKKRW